MSVLAKSWVDEVFPFYELIRIFQFYLDLECWIIPLDRSAFWNPIRYHNREFWPIELDDLFGRRKARDDFNRIQIAKVIREKRTVCSRFDGFYSFFIPILKRGVVAGLLQSGVFIRKIPNKAELIQGWKELTGSDVPGFDTDFPRYVRTVLETPLVEGVVHKGLKELLELFAGVLSGENEPEKACREAERMKKQVFSRYLPNRYWMEKTVKNNRIYPPHWWIDTARADQWRREEQGIERSPTTVLAVMLDEEGPKLSDDIDILLRSYRFQKEFFKIARDMPHTVSNPLEDYGMAFFTSPKPHLNEVQAKLEILDRIDRISRIVLEKLGARILVGVSRRWGSAQNLSQVFREAVLALEYCRPLSRPILFYEDLHRNPSFSRPPRFYELSKKLIDIYVGGAVRQIEPIRSHYIQKVLEHSAQRPEAVRLHFLFACGQLVDVLGKRKPFRDKDLSKIFDSLERRLRETNGLQDLVAVFKDCLRRLLDLNLRPGQATQSIQMDEACRYLENNFSEELDIGQVAKLHGFSSSIFAREFKRKTGLGFSAYLKKIRVNHAKNLLLSTTLSIARVSQEAGFNNIQYFYDVFKREIGQTPNEIRSESTGPHSKV